MKKGKFLTVIIAVCLCASMLLCFVSCSTPNNESVSANALQSHLNGAVYNTDGYVKTHDKAMIFMPGLMASAMYETDGDEQMWGMSRFVNLALSLLSYNAEGKTVEEKHAFLDETIKSIACDENNVPYTKLRVANMEDPDAYDAFGGMKGIYDLVEPVYSKQYDMIVWQYDWRQHNMGAAEQLELFINSMGYDKVMFFTHSMGGVVVANYLSRSIENRNKVELFMPFGGPFLGSMDAVTNLFPIEKTEEFVFDYDNLTASSLITVIQDILTGKSKINVFDFALGLINNILESDFEMQDLARTIPSVYQLLPFPSYNETLYFDSSDEYSYVNADSSISVEGEALNSEAFMDYLKEFSWTKKANGDYLPVVDNLENYQSNLYFDISQVPENLKDRAYSADGKSVFVTELVPTEYVIGNSMNTLVACNLSENGTIKDFYYSEEGDGTVPAYSATAGRPLDSDHVYIVNCIPHGPLLDNKNGYTVSMTGLQYVLGVLDNYIEYTDAELNL